MTKWPNCGWWNINISVLWQLLETFSGDEWHSSFSLLWVLSPILLSGTWHLSSSSTRIPMCYPGASSGWILLPLQAWDKKGRWLLVSGRRLFVEGHSSEAVTFHRGNYLRLQGGTYGNKHLTSLSSILKSIFSTNWTNRKWEGEGVHWCEP